MAEKLKKIGEGEFSEVFLTSKNSSKNSKQVVLKKYKSGKEAEARREYLFLQSIKSDNVVEALNFRVAETAELELKYIEGEILNPDNFTSEIMLQCLITLLEVHSRGIVINDIKPENILIRDEKPVFIDFGLASVDHFNDGRFRGTPAYSSPEKLRFKSNTKSSDIFSLGMLFLQMKQQINPALNSGLEKYKEIVLSSNNWDKFLAQVSDPLIKSMISYKPLERAKLPELIHKLQPDYKFSLELGRDLIFPSQHEAVKKLMTSHSISLNRYDEPNRIATLFKMISENEDRETIILDEKHYLADPLVFFQNLNVSNTTQLKELVKSNSARFLILHTQQVSTHNFLTEISHLPNCYSINESIEKPAIEIGLTELKEATYFLKIPSKSMKKWANNPPSLIRQLFKEREHTSDFSELISILNIGNLGLPVILIEQLFEDWNNQLSTLISNGTARLDNGFIFIETPEASSPSQEILSRLIACAEKMKLFQYAAYAAFKSGDLESGIKYFSNHITQLVKQGFYYTALEILEDNRQTYPILNEQFILKKRNAFLLRKNGFLKESLEAYDSLLEDSQGERRAVLFSDRAVVESELEHTDTALLNLKEAAEIFKQEKQHIHYARTLNNIGYTQYKMDELSQATRSFREVNRYAVEFKLSNWETVSMLNLADICLQQGQWQKAVHFGTQASDNSNRQNKADYQVQAELIVAQARLIRGDHFEYGDFIEAVLNKQIIKENQQLANVAACSLFAIYQLSEQKSPLLLSKIEDIFPKLEDSSDSELISSIFWLNYLKGDYMSAMKASHKISNNGLYQAILSNDRAVIKVEMQDLMTTDWIYRLSLTATLYQSVLPESELKHLMLEFCDLANAKPPILSQGTQQKGDLNFVWEIIQSILTGRDSSEIISATLKSLLKIGKMERTVYFKIKDNQPIVSQCYTQTGPVDPDSVAISTSVLQDTIKNRKLSFFTDLMDETTGSAAASIFGLGLRSAVCFPLIIGSEVEGIFYSDASSEESFSETHRMYLQVIFTQSSSVLEKLLLLDQLKLAATIHPPNQGFHGIIGSSRSMLDLFDKVRIVGKHNINVLINGETGTGKELIAKAIHQEYAPDSPFIAINCAAIPEHLLESELFGYEKGAFTGADRAKQGLFEAAGEGTVFLDEIGEMPLNLQPKVLRVLQERMVTPLGSTKSKPVNMRVVSATNRDLEELTKQNLFRSDLLYRISVFRMVLPTLNERHEDIPTLAKHFLDKFNQKFSKNIQGISPTLLQKMQNRNWPGNVRELENILEQAVVMSSHTILGEDALPGEIVNEITQTPIPIKWEDYKNHKKNSNNEQDQKYLKMLLSLVDGNYSAAARLAGISRIQLYRMRDHVSFK